MITRFAHVCLNVADLDRTIVFYHTILGLPIKFTFEKAGKVCGAYFQAGEKTFIEAFPRSDLKVVNTGIVHLCLETDDIDGFIRNVSAKGIACTPKKMGCDQSWQTWLQDPDGNKIEIHEYTTRSAQILGGVVQVDW